MIPSLTGYVIKHCEQHVFFANDAGATTDDFDKAVVYDSKLAAHQRCYDFWIARVDCQAEWQIVRRRDVEQKATPLVAPFALHIADPFEAVQRVYEWHGMYSERITRWLKQAGVTDIPQPAKCQATITSPQWAGIYMPMEQKCCYPIVYAMIASDFHVIVAHEVVHSFQRAFTGHRAGHGADFYAMMRHAAQEPVTKHKHNYSMKEAFRLAVELWPWWKEQGQRGLLNNLPMEVDTQPMKRKGITC